MDLAKRSDAAILEVADIVLNGLMEGVSEGDHGKYTRHFTSSMKRVVDKDAFESLCKRYQAKRGQYCTREPAAVLRRPGSVAVIWCQRDAQDSAECAIGLTLVETESRYLVSNLMLY